MASPNLQQKCTKTLSPLHTKLGYMQESLIDYLTGLLRAVVMAVMLVFFVVGFTWCDFSSLILEAFIVTVQLSKKMTDSNAIAEIIKRRDIAMITFLLICQKH